MRALVLLPLVVACAPAGTTAPPAAPAAPAGSSAGVAVPAPPLPSAGAPAAPVVPTGGAVYVGDINAPKSFDPKPTIVALSTSLVDCYNQARAARPELRGKLLVRIVVNEAGAVNAVEGDSAGAAYDAGLVTCIEGVMKDKALFPKPGGMATVGAPLMFRP